jgi:hypothetical protein
VDNRQGHIADPKSRPGINSNARGLTSGDYVPSHEPLLTHPFRLYDDEGNLYYEGRSSDADSEDAFNPLDDFGTPNAGCTEIGYYSLSRGDKAPGEWVTL